MHCLFYLINAEFHILRSCHPLILHIVFPVDHSDDNTLRAFDRFMDAHKIDVLFLLVSSQDSFDISIINGIIQVFVFRMIAAQRPVYDHFDMHAQYPVQTVFHLYSYTSRAPFFCV